MTKNSIYFKSIKRSLGWVYNPETDSELKIELPFANENDLLFAESALANVDENYIGLGISKWTGSSVPNSVSNLYNPAGDSLFFNDKFRGFYSASSVSSDGTPDSSDAIFIHRPRFDNFGEMGESLGDVDFNQIRYFKTGSICSNGCKQTDSNYFCCI